MRRAMLRMAVLVLLALALAGPAGAQGSVTGSVRGSSQTRTAPGCPASP